jgi:putative membrane protein
MLMRTVVGFFLVAALSAGSNAARAAGAPPSTADVLNKLHHSNQKEIEMGKVAEDKGQSKEVKKFGKTLVKDHTDADKKVTKLAKDEKIDLADMPAMKDEMPAGAGFDAAFSKSMLEDHKKDVAAATDARDNTTDDKLKKLLTTIVPVLQKHLDTAQKLVDTQGK